MAPTWGYFDTSALVKRYVNEPGSRQARALLRRHDFLSSAIAPVEAMSALVRRRRAGDLSEESFRAVLRRFQSDRTRWELVEVSAAVLGRAEELIQGGMTVKALDAIHIASIMTFQAAYGTRIPFVTGDAQQRDVAHESALDVVWVG